MTACDRRHALSDSGESLEAHECNRRTIAAAATAGAAKRLQEREKAVARQRRGGPVRLQNPWLDGETVIDGGAAATDLCGGDQYRQATRGREGRLATGGAVNVCWSLT
jgi:hypothetical protein